MYSPLRCFWYLYFSRAFTSRAQSVQLRTRGYSKYDVCTRAFDIYTSSIYAQTVRRFIVSANIIANISTLRYFLIRFSKPIDVYRTTPVNTNTTLSSCFVVFIVVYYFVDSERREGCIGFTLICFFVFVLSATSASSYGAPIFMFDLSKSFMCTLLYAPSRLPSSLIVWR